jgi:hypothetical protein
LHSRAKPIQWRLLRRYLSFRGQNNGSDTKAIIMGDRSPKSVQKQASQKQTKANDLQKQKQQAWAAKQAGAVKKK